MTDKDLKKLADLITVKISSAIRPATMRLDVLSDKINMVYTRLETLDEKADALTVDLHDLQIQTKAIWDKISIVEEGTKREIKEVKEHVGLSSS